MKIKISNCNNIDNAEINVIPKKINIEYGMNGTGKSTMATAIINLDNSEELLKLKPFGKEVIPSINSDEIVKPVLFNSYFVNNIVFKGNEVIDNSFDVFIKSPQYDEKRKQIDLILRQLTENLFKDENLQILNNQIKEIYTKIPYKSDKGTISKTGTFKSILQKENIFNVPSELAEYEDFIKDKNITINWIDWKLKGYDYDNKHKCPFCAKNFDLEYVNKKEIFKNTYKKPDAKNLVEITTSLELVKDFINEEKYNKIIDCIKKNESEDEINMVFKGFMGEVDYLRIGLSKIEEFDSYKVKREDIQKLDEIVSKMKIKTDLLNYFNNDLTKEVCNKVNNKLNSIIEKITDLKKDIGEINGLVANIINNSKKEINDFLNLAGFNYEFDIINEGNEKDIKTILRYINNSDEKIDVSNISDHLSWGEKNAFALVLFTYYALSKESNLIILDDPISSFDGNKKYAIINRLFANKNNERNLYGKTVLMLTHDFEPLIDFGVNHKPTGEASICFLKNSNNNILEKRIEPKEDIKSIIKINYNNAKNESLNIISRSVFARKYIECINVDNDEKYNLAYNILSSIIHDKKPTKFFGNDEIELTKEEISTGENVIKSLINEFDTAEILNYINSKEILNLYNKEKNNYIRTQLFRIYIKIPDNKNKLEDKTLLKFVDEIYHIENDYMFSLDLIKFDMVPDFIIDKINDFMKEELDNIK